MKPNRIFQKQPKSFWAQVKLISMTLGYSRGDKFKFYSIEEIANCLEKRGLDTSHLMAGNEITQEGQLLVSYFQYRANALEELAQPNLMTREQARTLYEAVASRHKATLSVPFNKQKGEKRHIAYLTGMVNALTEETLDGPHFDHDPRALITISRERKPLRTLSRRVDGAYPSTVNPIAIWEIKEYYGTTTFGSRVADGVYETLLDGYELEEALISESINVRHYLVVDDYYTWWTCVKSYLCRMVDMVHEGFVDEVIFGRQVVARWPELVQEWVTTSKAAAHEHLLRP